MGFVSFRLRRRVIDEFTDWARAQGIVPGGEAGRLWRERITILLQGRADYLDKPDPTRWRSGEVHDLFMTHVVPRQVDAWGLAEHGVDTIRDYLRFLDATDRLHPASTRLPTLLRELDRLAPKYPAAMADTSRWRLAKRVLTAVMADGIALNAEPAVLDAWAERFSARDAEGRREVLGELMDRHPEYATGPVLIRHGQVAVLRAGLPPVKHLVWPDLACDCGCEEQAQFPPIALPDPAVLAKEVATYGAGLLRQLAALAAWVGETGRTVDDRGEPRKSDRYELLAALGLPAEAARRTEVPGVARLWRLAIEFDIIQLRRTRVVPGAGADLVSAALAGKGSPEQALDLWSDLADALVHPSVPVSLPKGGEHLRTWLQLPWTPRSLGLLYEASATGEPADLDALTAQLLKEYVYRMPPGDPEFFAGLAAISVRQTLADLAQHGAVTIAGTSGEPDHWHAVTAAVLDTMVWALHPEPGLTVELTDLGRYLARQGLLAENAHVPLAH
jgi:hypothetical protein